MDRLLYQYLFDNSGQIFSFSSDGSKVINKVVLFLPTAIEESYAVVLGDLQNDGSIDVDGAGGNVNTEFILANVAKAIAFFLSDRPQAEVVIEGTTLARTRLYQMAIVRELKDIGSYFDIYGLTAGGYEIFQEGRTYRSFVISTKMNILTKRNDDDRANY